MKSVWQGKDLVLASKPYNPQPGLEVFDIEEVKNTNSTSPLSTPSPDAVHTDNTRVDTTKSDSQVVTKVAIKNDTVKNDAGPTAAVSAPTSGRLIVPSKSVGRISLGISSTDVFKILGKPTKNSGDVFTYQSQDRKHCLSLHLKADKVSAIAFNSTAFSTEDGITLSTIQKDKFDLPHPANTGNASYLKLKSGGFYIVKKAGDESNPIGVVTSENLVDCDWLLKASTPADSSLKK